MVIRARLVHNILDGFLFRASTIVLSDRLSRHREAGQREFSPMERPGVVCSSQCADSALSRARHCGAGEADPQGGRQAD